MKKPIIICIVGASGTGKTTLAQGLYEQYNIPSVCSYTTRPMRPNETEGVEHKFVKEFSKTDDEEILAYTVYGGYQYWTTTSQLSANLTTYVIDRDGLDMMRERFKNKYHIISVLVTRENITGLDMQRIERDKNHPTGSADEYDILIENKNGTIQEFIDTAAEYLKLFVEDIRKNEN